jgi:hypothetical protein
MRIDRAESGTDEAVAHAGGRPAAPQGFSGQSGARGGFQGVGSISSREMSETGLMVPDMTEPLSRYDVTVTIGSDGGSLPYPAAFAVAADQAAWSRFASIISAHLADKIISVVTVAAPDRPAAVAVALAVVSDALKRQALSPSQAADHPEDRAL